MDAVFYVAVCLLGFALVERRLSTTPITGPMIFVALGLLAKAMEKSPELEILTL